ncbi:heparinase II/III domain-containing protein [Sphingomicrobium aestuariivivum]|uniref:heparinase II/III domain-containing protein n=1 Tax=Sphingomicrobium aestuariivivum TaxID=1582356 RepID=UPI001FD6FF12|nr:heparinase II/III family protein [Sphingomicrobium aestuariivivum]MCJ8191574.1 heparinase II/III family protein [Sphingomicrobium aestuariivivum]
MTPSEGLRPYENLHGSSRAKLEAKTADFLASGELAPFSGESGGAAWLMGDQAERSKNFHRHNWAMLELPLAAYSQTREPHYLEAAIAVAADWIDHYATREKMALEPAVTDMAWYDMAVGLRAYRLAFIIDAMERASVGDPELVARFWAALELHEEYLADDGNIRFHNNHGFFQAAGQLAMGRRFAGRSEAMAEAHRLGAERFDRMLHEQFAEDGGHLEHSPGYHRMVYLTAREVVDAELVNDEKTLAFLDRIERALSWFVMPSGHIANLGDTDSYFILDEAEDARAKWRTREMRFAVTMGEAGVRPADPVRLFGGSGYCAARVEHPGERAFLSDSYLLQQAGFHSRTHKHADTLGFLWCDRGERILVDAGRYGYVGKTKPGSDLHKSGFWYADPRRIYCETTRAHNCLEFDGRDYPRRGIEPPQIARDAIFDEAQGLVVFDTACAHFEGVLHRRRLVLKPRQWLLCLDDFEDGGRDRHDVTQWFHFAPHIGVERAGEQGYRARLKSSSQPLHILPLSRDCTALPVVRGQEEPRLQGWWSPVNRKFEPVDTIGLAMKDRAAGTIATLFHFADGVPRVVESDLGAPDAAGCLGWDDGVTRHRLDILAAGEASGIARFRHTATTPTGAAPDDGGAASVAID